MLKGDTKVFWVVLTGEVEVLAILKGEGHKKFPPLKGESVISFTVLGGGGHTNLDSRFFYSVARLP